MASNVIFFDPADRLAFWDDALLLFDAGDSDERQLVVCAARTEEAQCKGLELKPLIVPWLMEAGLDDWDAELAWKAGRVDSRALHSLLKKLKQRELDDSNETVTLSYLLDSGEADREVECTTESITPTEEVTLLSADGGVGKTYLALLMLICLAAGRAFFNLHVEQCSCLFVSAEDRRFVIANRLKAIISHPLYALLNQSIWTQAAREHLHVWEIIGECLWIEDKRNPAGVPTRYLRQLEKRIQQTGARQVVLDNASSLFRANHSDNVAVNAFIAALRRIAERCNCNIMLLGHVSAESATGNNRKTYFGSTQWHNAVRSRLSMRIVEATEDSEAHILLTHEKSNYGKLVAPIKLRRDERTGILEYLSAADIAEVRDAKVSGNATDLLTDIRAVYSNGGYVVRATQGSTNSYSCLSDQFPSKYPEGDARKKREVKSALAKLKADERLIPASRPTSRGKVANVWVPVDAAP